MNEDDTFATLKKWSYADLHAEMLLIHPWDSLYEERRDALLIQAGWIFYDYFEMWASVINRNKHD